MSQGYRFPVDAMLSGMPPAGVRGQRMCVTVTSPLSPAASDALPRKRVPHLQSVIHSEVHISASPSLNTAARVIFISTKIPYVSIKMCFLTMI